MKVILFYFTSFNFGVTAQEEKTEVNTEVEGNLLSDSKVLSKIEDGKTVDDKEEEIEEEEIQEKDNEEANSINGIFKFFETALNVLFRFEL